MTCKTHYYTEVDETYHYMQILLLSILIYRFMGSFIDGFQDMEIRVSIKLSLIHVVVVISVQKNTWSKTLDYLLLILNKYLYAFNLEAFVLVCCICLNVFDKHLWVLIFWTPCSLFLVFWSYLFNFLWAIILYKLMRGK